MHSTRLTITFLGSLVILALVSLVSTGFAQTTADAFRPKSWSGVSTLHDVFFLNADRGFAVGDHGTILSSTDGGRTWARVYSGISADLQRVYFTDEKNGWALGGISKPFHDKKDTRVFPSEGVVLQTKDGGKRWHRISTNIPAVVDAELSPTGAGIALGRSSHFHPGGILTTSDAGKTWVGSSANQLNSWKALAQVQDLNIGLRDDSQICRIESGRVVPMSMLVPAKVNLNDIAFAKTKQGYKGIAVGDHFQVLLTNKNGTSWKFQNQPRELAIDLNTVATAGSSAWTAGTPGTYVYKHDFETGKWKKLNTGQKNSIRKLFFIDSERGWAVGDQGLILRTRDGGKTWQKNRGDDHSMAIMIIADSPDQIPFELLAKYSSEQGFLTSVVILNSSSSGSSLPAARHACSRYGNAIFQTVSIGRGSKQSQELTPVFQITRLIRMLRPHVIVSCQGSAGPQRNTAAFDLDQTVLAAFRAAPDKYQFPNQITETGLRPWEPSRLLIRAGTLANANLIENGSQVLLQLGGTMSDRVQVGRAILGITHASPNLRLNDLVAFRGSGQQMFDAETKTKLYRRSKSNHAFATMDQIKKSTTRKQLLNEMSTWHFDGASTRSWNQKIQQLLSTLDNETGGIWLNELAQRYWSEGHAASAVAAHELLVQGRQQLLNF